jgi:ribosome-associated protein
MLKKIILPESDVELLRECKVTAFRASGAGGRHVNVTDSAVRLVHLPTGITITSQKERSQYQNRQECIRKLRRKVSALNFIPKKRIATKVPRSIKEKRREKKQRHSERKQRRLKISEE